MPRDKKKSKSSNAERRFTDTANAKWFVAGNGGKFRYCEGLDWHFWEGRRWILDTNNQVMRAALETVEEQLRNEVSNGDTTSIKKAVGCLAESRIIKMVKLARIYEPISTDAILFDKNPWLLNVRNGTINLRTGKLQKHNRDDLITKLCDVDYQPDAECPLWDQFLLRVMGNDSEMVAFLKRAIGYALTGDTSEQVMFVFYGKGANGKTTFLETIASMMSDYVKKATSETLLTRQRGSGQPREDLTRLRGARFVHSVEIEAGQWLAEAQIKELTGGDTVTARQLYARQSIEYKPEFKLFLAANYRPKVRGTDPGIWRRILLVPFGQSIPAGERDKRLPQKLAKELPGILRWAVEGCREWQEHGLMVHDKVTKAVERYRQDMDPVRAFIDECCVADSQSWSSTKELFEQFIRWCQEEDRRTVTKQVFGSRLGEQGCSRKKRHGQKGWLGLRAQDVIAPGSPGVPSCGTLQKSVLRKEFPPKGPPRDPRCDDAQRLDGVLPPLKTAGNREIGEL